MEESKSDTWWKHLRQRLNQSTFLVQDCVFILYIVLVSVVVSFSTLSDNMLDIFYYASNKSEPVATAYVGVGKKSNGRPRSSTTCSMPSLLLVDCCLIAFTVVSQWWSFPSSSMSSASPLHNFWFVSFLLPFPWYSRWRSIHGVTETLGWRRVSHMASLWLQPWRFSSITNMLPPSNALRPLH